MNKRFIQSNSLQTGLFVLAFSTCATYADTAESLAEAMDVPTNSIVGASFSVIASTNAAKVRNNWGVSNPFAGTTFVVLSSGKAADPGDAGYSPPTPGTSFGTSTANPVAGEVVCGGLVEPPNAYDLTELELKLQAPTNAIGFKLKFNFFSADYPENICSAYSDRFRIVLTSSGLNGNIAFDSLTNPVSLNTSFFAVTNGGDLVGTGMEGGVGAAIGWQTAWAPVNPGETISLRFTIFDTGDSIGDSVAVIDAFEWFGLVTAQASIHRAVEIEWPSELNKNYQVEWSPVVNSNDWSALGAVVPGTGTNISVFDSTRHATNRFYRVRETP